MELFTLQLLLVLFLISLYSFRFFFSILRNRKCDPKGLKRYPLVGVLPDFLKNRHRFLDWSTHILANCPGNTVTFWRPGTTHGVLTANPPVVEHILKTNFENYPKGERFHSLLHDFLGGGIFNSDGDAWKLQRKTASYEFNTKSLRNFILDIVRFETSRRLIPMLEKASSTGKILDLQNILEQYAFDNICKLAFDVDPSCLGGDGEAGGKFMRAFEDAATLSAGRFMYAFPFLCKLKRFLCLGTERKLKKSIAVVHEFADEIIQARLESRTGNSKLDQDLLSRFIGTEQRSPEYLRDIIISFILAGRDTTSSALSWFFWLLSRNPVKERKIVSELDSIRQRNGKQIGDAYNLDEIREMQYLQASLSETLRLYPPVPVDTKACQSDDVLPDGTFIGKNWFVTYHTYAMGRMESIWGKNCEEFSPERWIDEDGSCQPESPFRFPVFHAGPRMCLGKEMAYIQMKCIAAAVLERFAVDVVGQESCPEHLLSLTLRMKGGLPVTVRER